MIKNNVILNITLIHSGNDDLYIYREGKKILKILLLISQWGEGIFVLIKGGVFSMGVVYF